WDARSNPEAMTPREVVAHLADCYVAVTDEAAGKEHEWGATVVSDNASEALAQMIQLRHEAIAALGTMPLEKANSTASNFIVLHDAYHVGQLATLRLHLGGWDPMSIYNM
ncbi:MAG: hypothetical protein ABUL72_06355, partial [Armatimonadota bacterium]